MPTTTNVNANVTMHKSGSLFCECHKFYFIAKMFRLGGGDEWKYGSCFNGFMLVFGCWLVGCSVLVEMAGHQSKRTDGSMFCLSIQHEWMGYDEATEQQRKNCIVKHWLLTDAYGKSPKTSWNLAGTIDWYRKVNAWWRWHCSLYSPRFPPRFARYSELLVLFYFITFAVVVIIILFAYPLPIHWIDRFEVE